MPSIPGEPAQTKYPWLYPWILSWVWSWNADFPENLGAAFWVNAVFGCGFLIGSFALLRQLDAARHTAVALTALCALHPQVQHLSGLLLSDVPFIAFAVGAAAAAGAALGRMRDRRQHGWTLWLLALLLGVLAVFTRSIGIAVVAGLTAAALLTRLWKPAGVAAALGLAVFAPAVASWLWPAASAASGGPGYEQTLLFYTSYGGFWRLSVPDLATFWNQLVFNLLELLKAPAMLCFLVPAGGFADGVWQAAAVALSAGILKGIWGAARAGKWHPIHFMLLFYIPLVLIWNYTLMERFLLLFLPLFLWGALQEMKAVSGAARNAFRQPAPMAERAVAAVMLALLGSLLLYAAYRGGWQYPVSTAQSLERREALSERKLKAYRWIRDYTAPDDLFVSYEDVNLHLHTGRQALRPLATSTASFFRQDKAILDEEIAHLADTARALGARYWLVAPDDFHLESGEDFLKAATEQLLKHCPVAFATQTRSESVRIYEISSLLHGGISGRPPHEDKELDIGGHAKAFPPRRAAGDRMAYADRPTSFSTMVLMPIHLGVPLTRSEPWLTMIPLSKAGVKRPSRKYFSDHPRVPAAGSFAASAIEGG